jgi:hypothetical protein
MKWRGKHARVHLTAASLRIDEDQAVEISNFAGRTYAPVKILKIGATAQRHVLAIIHVLAGRQNVRSRAAAEIRALLEQPDLPTGLSQRDAGCQTR